MSLRALLTALLASCLILQALSARAVESGDAASAAPTAKTPHTIALIATLGDQMTIVKQRSARATTIEPFLRRTLQVDGQMLNYAALRGLDSALAQEEPASRRVMLRWRTDEALAEKLKAADLDARDELLLEALRSQLRQLPQRAEWDRIEAILPRYSSVERDGMPRRLVGIGIYVQPQGNQWELFDDDGIDRRADYKAADQKTVNPRTGERGRSSAFVAPYIYFDRVTLDAKTLAVLARKSQYANTKYSDAKSNSIDVVDDISPTELVSQLNALVERAAYQSVRGKVEVEVGPVKPLPGK